MNNQQIAAVLREIAVFSDLAGENPFKVQAFDRGARIVERHPESLAALAAENGLPGLQGIKGIGKGLAEVIRELSETGRSSLLERLKSGFPAGLEELLALSGLGPKRVRALWQKLGIASVGELEYACRENRLLGLEGFGVKSQEKILQAIAFRKQFQEMHLYAEALAIAEELKGRLEATGLCQEVHIAGSLRRGKRILKDADMLVVPRESARGPAQPAAAGASAAQSAALQEALAGLADAPAEGGPGGVIAQGPTKVSIRRHGLQVDFRLVPAASRAAALQHFTGSKEHNTLLRARAKGLGLKMNEYGVFRAAGAPQGGEQALALADEEAVYRSLGLPWIPPELREGEEELEAAEAGRLPDLVQAGQIKGMIHAHSNFSDGLTSIEEMARECRRLGYEYLCLSDHSRSAAYAGGLSIERLREQRREIEELNARLAPFRVFAGVESDILADGSLDYPPEVLAELDFVIGSVHSNLGMSPEAATERLLAAVRHPALTILGHASGALLLSRAGYQYDEERLFTALAQSGAVLEHNCNPHRLDPDWPALKRAGRRGIRVALCPDAHSLEDLAFMSYGVTMARKAWLEPSAVLNCLGVEEIDAFFQARKNRC